MAALASKTYSLKTVLSCQDKLSDKLKDVRKNLKTLDRAFANTTKAAGEIAAKLAAPVAAVTGAGLFSLHSAVETFMSLGDSVDKAAIRAGVATGALQRLRAAAKLSGMSAEQMDVALTKLSTQMGKAAAGENEKLVELFSNLGVEWKDSSGKARDAATVMREIADAVKANEDPTMRLQMLNQIFGDELAARLIPALQGGAEGLDQMAAQADALGLVMSEKDVKAAAALGDTFGIFKDVIAAVSAKIGASLAPALTRLVEQIQRAVVANKDLIAQRIQVLVEQFASAIERVDLTAIIDGTIRFVEVVAKAFDAVGGMKTVMIGVAAVLAGQAVTSIVSLTQSVYALGAAFYATVGWPGLVVAAVAAAAALLYTHFDEVTECFFKATDEICGWFTGAWDAAVEKVKNLWLGFKEFIQPIVDWISEKLKSVTELIPDFSAIGEKAKSFLPDWMVEMMPSGGKEAASAPVAAPASRVERYGFGGAAPDGTVTIRVMTDKDSKASVEGVSADSGTVNVESGSYDYLDTF